MHLRRPKTNTLVVKADMFLIWGIYGLQAIPAIWAIVWMWVNFDVQYFQETVGFSIAVILFLIFLRWKGFGPTIISTFDSHAKDLTIEKKWLWKTETETIQYLKIKDIHVVQKGTFGKAQRYFRIEVELLNQDRIRLSTPNYRPKRSVESDVKQIKGFLWPGLF